MAPRIEIITMKCSLAQLEANKKNAQASTGPRTPLGKSVARRNSLKHGLTGEGIVLPTEDVEKLDARFASLEAEMKPRSELARGLVSRIALLMIKLDRSAEHEAKAIAHRMRKAEAEFNDARLAEMENYYSWIAAEPATNARRLRSSPEGIQRLLSVLQGLRDDLTHPDGHRWDWQRCEQLHYLLGLRRVDVPISRARALSDAIEGNFRHLEKADGAELDPKARQDWAVQALAGLIDGEVAKLHALDEAFDHEGLALDRAEAAHRAIFDPSPAAVLARKYEAASERGFYRAIQEFRELQDLDLEVETSPPLETEPVEELGSSFPEPDGEIEEAMVVDSIVVESINPPPMKLEPASPSRVSRRKSPDRKPKRGR